MEDIAKIEESAVLYGPKIVFGLLIIAFAILTAYLVRFALRRFLRKYEWAGRVGNLLATTIYYAILVLGVLTGLSTMGVAITPIVAGLGLGGFALGFALRDALGNLLAGVLIIIYQPFKRGDVISVSGCEGTVAETNLRYTMLESDQENFMVPNSLILKNPVKIILQPNNDTQESG
jgi:small-conductance mechanosensitive channel